MRLFIEVRDEQPPDVSKRKFAEFSRGGMNAIGLRWDREFKMRHFEPDAAQRYGLARRKPKYQRSKERRAGHPGFSIHAARPLIKSGRLRIAARQNAIPKAMPKRVVVKLNVPYYAKMTPTARTTINLGDEMTRTLGSENRELQDEYRSEVEDDLNNYREPRTTLIG